MEDKKVDMFIMSNNKHFEPMQLNSIREKLNAMDDNKWGIVSSMKFKDPTTLLIISILLGQLGVDRFMLGETGKGIGKLLTCGGLGIWAIVDWFLISKATREKNFEQFQQLTA
jgi:TM2 domain-containing membrane protein YozV